MENDQYGNVFPLELYVTTSEKHPVHVQITSPKWTQPSVSESVTVSPGQVVRVKVSDEFRMKGSLKSSKVLLVKSDGDIAVYGGNKEDYSNDVFCGIPTDALGNEYYAMCYGPAFRKTELGVAATQDNTVVKVTLPKSPNMTVTYNSKTYHGGDVITVNLDKYENFQLQSVGDLTGAHIVATHPVSAYSGNIKTNIGSGKWQDHLVEQLTPVDTWGKKFVTAPIPKRTVGDYFRIVASEDNTVVNIAGMPSITLAKPCTPTKSIDGDGLDNDCDGKIDEELCTTDNNKQDDDGDGKFDEDCTDPTPGTFNVLKYFIMN
ncbi:IgGFc-binding protein-like [Mytilus californianus]|uniref:IgGFc-binding protein-like n=1 Tax=Mytilus californianus TaxID=6549 RepID=UPI002246162D|nr:IgGFc-binding protein-like [Mytilus californianus]